MFKQSDAMRGILRMRMEVLHAVDTELLAWRRGDDGISPNVMGEPLCIIVVNDFTFNPEAQYVLLYPLAPFGNFWRLRQIHPNTAPAAPRKRTRPTPPSAEKVLENHAITSGPAPTMSSACIAASLPSREF